MSAFFLVVELLSYVFIMFLLLKKKELAIAYLPAVVFANNMIVPIIPASVYYLAVTVLVFSIIYRNPSYYRNNIPAIILLLYILILLPRSSDLVLIRPYVFSILWLLTVIPAISAIYRKYSRDVIFKELNTSAMIILALFIVNALVSTVKGYSPKEMYGITSGILYGNIIAEGFNVIALSIFVVTLGFIEHKKVLNLIILAVTFSFIMLSLRRSVMGISAMGIGIAYLTILTKEKAKTFFAFGCLALMLGLAIVTTTDLADHFKERYELRKLDERELEEEKRFFEYELLYKDMFVYRDYSPLIGYELFNSWGNYGRGVLEERSLHGDLTSITHSTGFIGLFLYLLMVFSAFKRSFRSAESRTDMLTIIFCALSFMIYTITGRYTEIGATMMLYLVLMLPLAKKEAEAEEAQTESEVMEPNVRQKSLATTKIDTQAIHS